jgi:hypothetical protein
MSIYLIKIMWIVFRQSDVQSIAEVPEIEFLQLVVLPKYDRIPKVEIMFFCPHFGNTILHAEQCQVPSNFLTCEVRKTI